VRHLVLCAAVKDDELPLIEAIVSATSLEPGQTLFGEGEPVCYAYNVAAGTLRLFKLLPDGRRQITGFALAGDFVGLSSGGMHPYGAEAVDRVELCRFPLQGLSGLFARVPEMEHRLLEMRDSELVAAQDRMMLLGRKTPVEKIATFLLEISARQMNWGRAASPVILPMTRGDIADYLGLTVETVSRCFTRLKADGAIALPEPTSVVLLDRERLQRLSTASDAADHAAL
jgi:CRP/FNR family transcriptional regulator